MAQSLHSKPHYAILDGLRGVAAIMVLWYHIFEAFAESHFTQTINHGYLAVDFFFMLSGFVIGYSYDDRIEKLGEWGFIKRRLIRLHPMVILGAIIGACTFYLSGCEYFKVNEISFITLLGALALNLFLIPATPENEIRGLGEMYPLNGPSWSLFFEYIGNLIYVFILRRFSTKTLSFFVVIMALSITSFAIFGKEGYLGYGWTITSDNILGGNLRLFFAFPMGLLLSRIFKRVNIKNAFWFCSLIIIAITIFPGFANENNAWLNGIYDVSCVIIAFPIVIWLGASETTTNPYTQKLCKLLGDISYPLYIVHYPFIYIYYAWVKNNNLTFQTSLPGAVALIVGVIFLAYLSLKIYDIPIRRYLSKYL